MADTNLFLREYKFCGKHAAMSRDFTEKKIDDSGAKIFQTNIDLFIFCALYGVIVNRKSKPDETTKATPNKIFAEQFGTHSTELKYAFKFVTLNGNAEKYDALTRLNKTFRNPETPENYTAFEEYMLGGLEELHEKIMVASNIKYEDYLTALSKIVEALSSSEESMNSFDDPPTDDFF